MVVKVTNSFNEEGKLALEVADTVVVIDGKPQDYWWRGQNQRTFDIGDFPGKIAQNVAGKKAKSGKIHSGRGKAWTAVEPTMPINANVSPSRVPLTSRQMRPTSQRLRQPRESTKSKRPPLPPAAMNYQPTSVKSSPIRHKKEESLIDLSEDKTYLKTSELLPNAGNQLDNQNAETLNVTGNHERQSSLLDTPIDVPQENNPDSSFDDRTYANFPSNHARYADQSAALRLDTSYAQDRLEVHSNPSQPHETSFDSLPPGETYHMPPNETVEDEDDPFDTSRIVLPARNADMLRTSTPDLSSSISNPNSMISRLMQSMQMQQPHQDDATTPTLPVLTSPLSPPAFNPADVVLGSNEAIAGLDSPAPSRSTTMQASNSDAFTWLESTMKKDLKLGGPSSLQNNPSHFQPQNVFQFPITSNTDSENRQPQTSIYQPTFSILPQVQMTMSIAQEPLQPQKKSQFKQQEQHSPRPDGSSQHQQPVKALNKEFIAELEKDLGQKELSANLMPPATPTTPALIPVPASQPAAKSSTLQRGLLPPPPSNARAGLSRRMSNSMTSLNSGQNVTNMPQHPSAIEAPPVQHNPNRSHYQAANLRVALPNESTVSERDQDQMLNRSFTGPRTAHVRPFVDKSPPLTSANVMPGNWRPFDSGPQYQPLRNNDYHHWDSPEDDYSERLNTSRAVLPPSGAPARPINHLEVNKVAQVGKMVPGVSASQVRAALEAVNWDTSIAIKNLKIDKLYRIGVADKPKCEKVLASMNWDLERAASLLLEQ